MFFDGPLSSHYQPKLNGAPIDWVSNWKCLGVVLTSGRKFDCSISERVKPFYRSLNSILRVEGRSDDMVLLRLLEAHCVPIITYAISNRDEQGRIHGNPVADGWAGAVMRKPLGIQKCDIPTYRCTDRYGKVESRVRD